MRRPATLTAFPTTRWLANAPNAWRQDLTVTDAGILEDMDSGALTRENTAQAFMGKGALN